MGRIRISNSSRTAYNTKQQAKILKQMQIDAKIAALPPRQPALPPAGWYGDPAGQPFLRWWDGQQWTEHTHEAPLPG